MTPGLAARTRDGAVRSLNAKKSIVVPQASYPTDGLKALVWRWAMWLISSAWKAWNSKESAKGRLVRWGHFRANSFYFFLDLIFRSFQLDGTWSHPLPKCLAPCIVPDVPMGRVVNLTSSGYRNTVMHGDNISIVCNKNYELEGNATQITCNNGTFNKMPRCEPARCKTLPLPPKDGMVVVSFLQIWCYSYCYLWRNDGGR